MSDVKIFECYKQLCKVSATGRLHTLTDICNAVVTCEIKSFQNYFSLRRRTSEMILFQFQTC